MEAVYLKFYCYEHEKQGGVVLHEWLLEYAKRYGIKGGSAFRGIAGFGRHGKLHEEHIFELASNVPVEVNFVVTKEEQEGFLNLLRRENADLFYVTFKAESATLSSTASA